LLRGVVTPVTIEQELKILLSADLWRVPPKFASTQRNDLNAGFLDISHSLWDDSEHPRECAQSAFCCPGHLHASVVMLFECQVGTHPDSQPSCRLFVESDETVSYLDFGREFWLEVLLMAFPACEKCSLHLCGVELEISSAGPLDALHCAGFKLFDHLVHVLPGCHGSEVVYEGEAFGLYSLFHPLFQSSGAYCKENQRYG
jgi:hypothetical protein